MDLLRKSFVPVFQAPDIPGATPDAPVVVPDPAATPDTPPDPAPEKTVPVSVMVREITPLRATIREKDARLSQAERTIAEQNALLSRLQNPSSPPDPAAPPLRQPVQQPQPDDVDRRAAELLLQRDMQALDRQGATAYGAAWGDTVRLLESFNLNTPEFISSVTEIAPGKSHEVLRALTQDGEKLALLATLSPVARIAEITRMAMAPAAQKIEPTPPATPSVAAKTVSRAPAPPPPVDPSASKVKDWRSDDASDEEFTAGFNETMAKRAARR